VWWAGVMGVQFNTHEFENHWINWSRDRQLSSGPYLCPLLPSGLTIMPDSIAPWKHKRPHVRYHTSSWAASSSNLPRCLIVGVSEGRGLIFDRQSARIMSMNRSRPCSSSRTHALSAVQLHACCTMART